MLYRIPQWSSGYPGFNLPPTSYISYQRVPNHIQTDPVQHKRIQPHLLSYCDLLVEHSAGRRMPAAICQVQNSADVNDCRPCFYPLHCTAFIRRHPYLPSCTYPPHAPGTSFAVRYYSTELAHDMEEEEDIKSAVDYQNPDPV